VVLGVERHRRVPVGGRLEKFSETAVLDDQQFDEEAREAPRPEVAAVAADACQELLRQADLARDVVEPALEVVVVERRAVDGRADGRGVGDVVAGHEVDLEAVDLADDVGVLGVVLVAVRDDGVPHAKPVGFEFLSVEARREPHEHVDVAVAREPRVPCRAPEVEDVRLDVEVGNGCLGAVEHLLHDRLEGRPLVGVGRDPVADPLEDGVDRVGHAEGLRASA